MTNELLVHELLLDPAYRLPDRGCPADDKDTETVYQMFSTAFWDSLVTDRACVPSRPSATCW